MRKIVTMMALGLLALPGQAAAADNTGLAREVEELREQNRRLAERISSLEGAVGQQPHEHAEPGLARKPAGPAVDSIRERLSQVEQLLATEDAAAAEKGLGGYVEFSGLVEVEAVTATDYGHQQSSDLSLATMELGLLVHISDWSMARPPYCTRRGQKTMVWRWTRPPSPWATGRNFRWSSLWARNICPLAPFSPAWSLTP